MRRRRFPGMILSRRLRWQRRSLALIVVGLLCGCERQTARRVTAASVSPAQFQQLRWLEGSWRGSGGGFDAFFEGYRWVDDSTIRKYGYADSTLATVTDSGDITLRGTTVRSESPERAWVVEGLDSVSVRFAPERNAANDFEWRRVGPGAWTARLTWDSAGVPREVLYELRSYRAPITPR